MNNEKKDKQVTPSSTGTTKGSAASPDDALPSDEEPETSGAKEIPIGTPISPEKLRRLKSRAERPQSPPDPTESGRGQQDCETDEDPSET